MRTHIVLLAFGMALATMGGLQLTAFVGGACCGISILELVRSLER